MSQTIFFSKTPLKMVKSLLVIIILLLAGAANLANACTITVSASATVICTGSSITFTGIIGGASHLTTYQWKKNGVAMIGIGASGSIASPGNGPFTFTTNVLANGDVITCYITEPAASFTGTSAGLTITVHTMPAGITGSATVGTGGAITLSDVTVGGTWTSSKPAVAAIGSTSGTVAGVAAGSAIITYNVAGCYVSKTISDVIVPSITGATAFCAGASATLADATTGGTWSSGNTLVATVGSATGIVTGVSAGTATISYKVYGAAKTAIVTVNMRPATITGSTIVGVGGVVTLSDATAGGVWASSRTSVATVCSTCGGVTGIATGTSTITYTYTLNGCFVTTTVHVVPVSGTTGITSVCAGASTTLADATAGGTWSTGNAFIATVGSTGIVTGVAAGTTNIIYKVYGTSISTVVTVYAIPAAIAGTTTIGVGGAVTLSDATSGGTWTSSRVVVATIGSATGNAVGVSAGSSIITYSVNGCRTSATFSVISIAAITGGTTICSGSSATLSDLAYGGTWSSSNTSVAVVGSLTGTATGIAAGTAIVSYKVGVSVVTAVVTVNASPNSGTITGVTNVAPGATTSLSDAASGGAWSSGNAYVATVSAAGLVSGIADGSATITYSVTNGCGTARSITTVTVLTVTSCSPIISTVAGNHIAGFSGNGGSATVASLNNPYGVAVDGSGNIYIADKGNNCIRKVSASGTISTFAGTGAAGYSGDNGAATSSRLNAPAGVACDGSGNVYVADQGNNCIRRINSSGIISTYAGNGTGGYAGDGGNATSSELNQPVNVAADASGNLFIVDFFNNVIRKVNSGGIIRTVAGNGTAGFSGDGGAATAAKLYRPTQVACDASGNIYIDDENNDRIRKVNAAGVIITIAGNGTDGFSGDGGAATAAELNETWGVCVDRAGNVYIADQVNERIRMVNIYGVITTICGTGVRGPEGDGGPATAGHLYNPYGICVDASGNLFIADNINQCIRKISVCSIPVSPVSGASNVCLGAAITVTDAAPGGTWTSSNTSVAIVGPTTGVVTGLAAGTVSITYTLGATAIVTLTVLPSPSVTASVTNPTCNGYSNGDIMASATGGSTSGSWLYYNYSWSNGSTSSGIWGVPAGSYSVVATDPNGCSGSASFTVAQPAALAGTGVVSDATAYAESNGSIAYTVTGGTGGYTYLWNNGATTENISSLAAGSYFVSASDANGCSVSEYYTVNQPACGRKSNPNGADSSAITEMISVSHMNAYPNPFASTTNITFSMIADGHAVVEVFNAINGEKVETLFNDDTKAGKEYSCVLNGANLSSGIYIYKISSGNNSYTGRVALAK